HPFDLNSHALKLPQIFSLLKPLPPKNRGSSSGFSREGFQDGRESDTVLGTGSMQFQSRQVFLGSVAFMVLKAVLGKLPMQFPHPSVPCDLGDNGSRGDAGGKGVPVDQRRL